MGRTFQAEATDTIRRRGDEDDFGVSDSGGYADYLQ